MTAAGVQSIDTAAHLPPASTSTPDAKGTGAMGKPAADAQAADAPAAPSDFQSELALQQSATPPSSQQEPESAGLPKADPAKTGSGKSAKKRSTPAGANLAAVTPVQVIEPQKQILPLALALPQQQELTQRQQPAQQQENAKPDDNAGSGEKAAPNYASQKPVQPVQLLRSQIAASNASPATAADPGKVPVLPLVPVPSEDIPVRQEGKKSEDPASQNQAVTPVRPGASSENRPVQLADLKLPATPAEPVASTVQAAADSAVSGPSALAFAARMPAAQQKSDQAVAVDPSQSSAVSGSQTAVQIPVRYAATAQIIQSAALGTQQDGPKKDNGASSDGPARPDARTDMVLPQFETVSQPVPSSGSAAPQQTAPPASPDSVMEPPAAPPTSSHDIRVQVPDNSGGATQVRFVESGGEVRVSVRTADEGLAQNLRTHLNDLTQRLSDGGMPAEIWKPASNPASSQNDSQQQSPQDGRGSGGQGSGSQSGQQDRQQKRPAWLDEMEASLYGEQN